ncbi:MAG TPA: hypothetical protein VN253_29575 [Kofleriaceae bacterium]|nr:hypothetical protein [Kofleriaceae bacterium]
MTATVADPLARLATIGTVLDRKAPAIIAALIAFLESIVRAFDTAPRRREAPVISHPDREDTAIASADELPEFLQRLLGWSTARLADVDHAFRAVRELASGRAILILLGEGSLLGVARRLHELTLPKRPFVELGPGDNAIEALDRAAGGMGYVEARDLPRDLARLAASVRPESSVRLMIGAEHAWDLARLATMLPRIATVRIPPIAERKDELDRLIEVYGHDAMAALGADDLGFRPYDLEWIRARRARIRTLADIEEVTRRVVALRNWGVTHGAERLGITHGALSRWVRRRGIPT